MNILMINPVHPATPHISAVRAWRFASELAVLGHKVILLTAAQQGQHPASSELIADHDWKQVFIVACATSNKEAEEAGALPKYLRMLLTAWKMLKYGGRNRIWADNAMRAAHNLNKNFSPDVIWCTFGMLEAVFAAKNIAASTGCPWVLDIKDNWELYIPRGLRRLIAWRTRGWAAVTANARFTAGKARLWQKTEARVIYSGVDEVFFQRKPTSDLGPTPFYVNLVGGIYFADRLEDFLQGIEAWSKSLSHEQRTQIKIRYLGSNGQIFNAAASRCLTAIEFETMGYVDVNRMAGLCQNAAINAYIAHPGTFHHKLLELLACGRPLMAYPAETEESRDLARQAAGVILETANAAQVTTALTKLHRAWLDVSAQPASPEPIRRYSWAIQAKLLEQVMSDFVST